MIAFISGAVGFTPLTLLAVLSLAIVSFLVVKEEIFGPSNTNNGDTWDYYSDNIGQSDSGSDSGSGNDSNS